MRYFRHRRVERLLREQRPQLSGELRIAFEARVERRTPRARGRLLAAGLVTLVAVAVASVGGLGYAASSAKQAASSVKRAFEPPSRPRVAKKANAGGDQYRPGYGLGDPNQNHTGPPGLKKKEGEPNAAPRRQGGTIVISTTIALSEQAVLHLTVTGPGGRAMTISQSGSSVGGEALSGPAAKSITFTVLVPRAVDINLAVPLSDVDPGSLTIRVTAVDVEGNKSSTSTPVPLAAADLKTVTGSERADAIPPSGRSDEIATGAGNDVINTGAGDDKVDAGAGNDTVNAPSGNNQISGGSGNDRVRSGGGADRIDGGPGRDVIASGGGADTINTRDRDRDLVNAGRGRDTCIADSRDILISCEIVRISR